MRSCAGLLLTLLFALTGCLRWGYEPASAHKTPGAMDAGAAASPQDAGSSSPIRYDAGTLDAGQLADATMRDAALSSDAAVSGAATPQDAAAEAGADDDSGTPPPPCPGTVNACGGCEALSAAPNSACGTCGLGTNTCSGKDALFCTGGTTTPITPSGALLLDDFEDVTRQFSAGPIRGDWYLVSDSTTGVLTPATDDGLVPTGPGAHASTGALHVSGSGFSQWGAGIQASLNVAGCYVNAAAQTGISFYARGSGTVQLAFATKQTVPTADGGSCVGTCYDNFATSFTLTSTWQPFQIPWSALHQAGFGTPTTFQPTQLRYLQFSFAAGSSMNLYLDDVSLY